MSTSSTSTSCDSTSCDSTSCDSIVAVEALPLFEGEARARQVAAAKVGGEESGRVRRGEGEGRSVPSLPDRTQDDAARATHRAAADTPSPSPSSSGAASSGATSIAFALCLQRAMAEAHHGTPGIAAALRARPDRSRI